MHAKKFDAKIIKKGSVAGGPRTQHGTSIHVEMLPAATGDPKHDSDASRD